MAQFELKRLAVAAGAETSGVLVPFWHSPPVGARGVPTGLLGGGGGLPTGGNGGSGIVIVRYVDSYAAATSTTGSPNVIVSGGYRVYKWTSSGSITF